MTTMPHRAVVADDDAELRRVVALAMTQEGFEVQEIADGGDLIRLVEQVAAGGAPPPHVIIADIRMPGSSGLKVLASMRRLRVDIPVVLVTGFGDPPTHELARKLGAAATFDKPFHLDEIRHFVASLVRLRS